MDPTGTVLPDSTVLPVLTDFTPAAGAYSKAFSLCERSRVLCGDPGLQVFGPSLMDSKVPEMLCVKDSGLKPGVARRYRDTASWVVPWMEDKPAAWRGATSPWAPLRVSSSNSAFYSKHIS